MKLKRTIKDIEIYSKGYGVITQDVMFDKNLSVEAKAIYSYIASYNNEELPTQKVMCEELNMSVNRYKRHMKDLVKFGYLEE